ncbi:MAG: acetyl-CoA C-acyltransferase, partial [Actinobacteria bacterium]|nr:acetyl-CoA C-acyltransferase [Actinomycetota bacterium]NIS32231.1 acetyl-CoA C-acyltransferase [Actinomycetota bacterium]NIT96153.1 acetyl-CoA C-acyltransferase [Actinomycetota bacterium]NIU19839.1 acetyl-CoA C-acyltransferase [Actinomycetota bacterium]NIU67279.1 acetyl-CoA C-acyltransferase [Actinomycetota bacterium]
SSMHSINLLGDVQKAIFDRTGMDPAQVGQVVGGCVGQVGMQTMNVARNAWLAAGLPLEVAATTVDAQCGSSQQATNLAYSLVKSGVVDSALSCGVELMSRIKMGATIPDPDTTGVPVNQRYWEHYEWTSQFEGAERIADKWGLTREDADRFGLRSQELAATAWAEDAFGSQIVPIEAPVLDQEGNPTDETVTVTRDGGLRDTTLEGLAGLKPVAREDGVHTAGSSSQISDGAGAVLMMTAEKADELGLTPLARIVDSCLVGTDPVLMLTGPIDATRKLLGDNGLTMSDIDVVEINEAFASVVLAWEKELEPDMATVNPNGGAIALGHPLGGTGSILMTKAVHEMQRSDLEYGIVTMCCGGGLGTGTLLRRL